MVGTIFLIIFFLKMKKYIYNYVFDLCMCVFFFFLSELSYDIYNRIVNILFDVREIFPPITITFASLILTHHRLLFCFFLYLSLMGLYSLSKPTSLLLSFHYLHQCSLSPLALIWEKEIKWNEENNFIILFPYLT